MESLGLQFDGVARGGVFLVVFIVLAIIEITIPRRTLIVPKLQRWFSNLVLIGINNLLIRVVFPGFLIGVSVYASYNNIGVFNYFHLPTILNVTLSIVMLDLIIYGQHVVFHKFNILWQLHKVHHVDLDLDLTTGLRFHPIEIVISLFIKASAVLVIGAPILAIILFQVILNITAMFNHSNIKLPRSLDSILRLVIVTPDMHLVHHSDIQTENNSNYGFSLSIWDKIFKTYQQMPKLGIDGMKIGVKHHKQHKYSTNLLAMLLLPFKKSNTN